MQWNGKKTTKLDTSGVVDEMRFIRWPLKLFLFFSYLTYQTHSLGFSVYINNIVDNFVCFLVFASLTWVNFSFTFKWYFCIFSDSTHSWNHLGCLWRFFLFELCENFWHLLHILDERKNYKKIKVRFYLGDSHASFCLNWCAKPKTRTKPISSLANTESRRNY